MKKIAIILLGFIALLVGVYSCNKAMQDSDYSNKIQQVQIENPNIGLSTRKLDWFKVIKMGGTDMGVGFGLQGMWSIPILGGYMWIYSTFGASFCAAICCGGGYSGNSNTEGYGAIDLTALHNEIATYSSVSNPYETLGRNHNILLNHFAGEPPIIDNNGNITQAAIVKLQSANLEGFNSVQLSNNVSQYQVQLSTMMSDVRNNYEYYNTSNFQSHLTSNENALVTQTLTYLETINSTLTVANVTQYIDQLESITIASNSLSESEKANNLRYLAGLNYSIAYWIKQNQ